MSEFSAILLGLFSAASWGAADFSGGFASKRTSPFAVVVFSQIAGVIFLIGAARITGEVFPPSRDLILGAVAGLSGAVGLLALYQGLARGRMSVVAPTSALVTAVLPVTAGISLEGWPGTLQVLGFGLAILAVWFVSQSAGGGRARLEDLRLPFVAGFGFGIFFVLIDQLGTGFVYWPLVSARVASITAVLVFSLASRRFEIPVKSNLPIIFLSGIFDVGGNIFFTLATQAGRLDISSILASLYPAGTVILAWIILKERLTPRQWLGVAGTLVAIGLLAG